MPVKVGHRKRHIPEFGMRVTMAREKMNWTRKAMANRMLISEFTLASWENGLSSPSLYWLRELARLLQTTSDALLGKNPEYE